MWGADKVYLKIEGYEGDASVLGEPGWFEVEDYRIESSSQLKLGVQQRIRIMIALENTARVTQFFQRSKVIVPENPQFGVRGRIFVFRKWLLALKIVLEQVVIMNVSISQREVGSGAGAQLKLECSARFNYMMPLNADQPATARMGWGLYR